MSAEFEPPPFLARSSKRIAMDLDQRPLATVSGALWPPV